MTEPTVVDLYAHRGAFDVDLPDVVDDVVAPPFDVTPYLAAAHYVEQLSLLSRLRVREPTRCRSVTDVVAVDLFAGGGGASLGIEQATDRSPVAAVNHDWHAIQMHMANHPLSIHFHRDVWEVQPSGAVNGAKIDLLWCSPDCTHHSRARGGKPRQKDIRGLAWVIIEWAAQVRPTVIAGENVPEFLGWGPLHLDSPDVPEKLRNRPIPDRKGETFDAFRLALGPGVPEDHPSWGEIPERVREYARRGCGYDLRTAILNAANHGAPTSRSRLYFVARCDGEPVRFPEPTHGPGRAQPWRTAAECLDFEEPSLSIFASPEEARAWSKARKVGLPQRPLADATMRRIAEGIRRFVLTNADPYIVVTGQQSSDSGKVRPVHGPLSTIVTKAEHCLVTPVVTKFYGASVGAPVDAPAPTHTERAHLGLVAPVLTTFYGTSKAGATVEEPMPTVTAQAGGGHLGVAEAVLAPALVCTTHQDDQDKPVSSSRIADVQAPLPTVTGANRGEWAEIEATMEPAEMITPIILRAHGKGWDKPGKASGVTKPDQSFPTITATEEWSVVTPVLVRYNSEQPGRHANAHKVTDPLNVVPTENRFGLITPILVQSGYGEREGQAPRALDITKPLGTVVGAGGKHALVSAFMAKHYGGVVGHGLDRPLGTVTSIDHHSVVEADVARPPAQPDRREMVAAFLVLYYGSGGQWQKLDEPMKTIVSKARLGLVEVTLNGVPHVITDIRMRMLTPRELARAQGFPDSYILTGTKAQQIARIGNSVCPPVARAIVEANFGPRASPEQAATS